MSHSHDFVGVTRPKKILTFVTGSFLQIEQPCPMLKVLFSCNIAAAMTAAQVANEDRLPYAR